MKCDICNNKFSNYINFGKQPIANHYNSSKKKYTSKIGYCKNDLLLKNTHNFSNKFVFLKNYPYYSSLSKYHEKYLFQTAKYLFKKLKLKKNSKIIEIGSSDGSFLKYFNLKKNFHIGIEPALYAHLKAKRNKINSLNYYFNKKTQNYLISNFGLFDLIYSANTIGHIDNIRNTLKLIYDLLNNKGYFIFENISCYELLQNINFDQLYDEHIYTLSFTAVNNLCNKFKLNLFNIEKTNIQGGSLRFYITKDLKVPKSSNFYYYRRKETNFIKKNPFNIFKNKTRIILKNFKFNLNYLNKKNVDVYGFGASAKATFLINSLKLSNHNIKKFFDNSEYKIGKYLPGTNIEITNEILIKNISKSIKILFAWNHYEEILKKHRNILKNNNIKLYKSSDFFNYDIFSKKI